MHLINHPTHPSTQPSHAHNTPTPTTHPRTTTQQQLKINVDQFRMETIRSNLPAVCMSSMSRSCVDIAITHLILKQSKVVLLNYSFKGYPNHNMTAKKENFQQKTSGNLIGKVLLGTVHQLKNQR